MNWKPIFKPREKASPKTRGTSQDQKTKADWLDQVVVRLATKADLPGMEWDGEFTHFRRVYAEAYQRMERGYTLLWVAELADADLASQVLSATFSGSGLVGQVFIQMVCDRPELADGIEK